MAGSALPARQSESIAPPTPSKDQIGELLGQDRVREAAAKLYGRGIERRTIAIALRDHLCPPKPGRTVEQQHNHALRKLRRWETQQSFRDMVYHMAVVKLDMSTPQILVGIGRKAARGRVDAARLALELVGRHNPKGEQAPTQVAVIFQGIPRPAAIEERKD